MYTMKTSIKIQILLCGWCLFLLKNNFLKNQYHKIQEIYRNKYINNRHLPSVFFLPELLLLSSVSLLSESLLEDSSELSELLLELDESEVLVVVAAVLVVLPRRLGELGGSVGFCFKKIFLFNYDHSEILSHSKSRILGLNKISS